MEGGHVGRIDAADETGAIGGKRGTELVAAEDPAEDDGRASAKPVGSELDRRRDCGKPVEAVKGGEDRQFIEAKVGGRQIEEREAAQAVIPEEQPATVAPVREPPRTERPNKVEPTDSSQHAARQPQGA